MDSLVCNYDKHNKIWSSPGVPSIYNYESSLGRIIFNQMSKFPNEICQIDDVSNVSLKTGEALIWGIRIAQHLNTMELNEDDIIGFAVKNTTYVLPAVLGCFFNGTTFHNVNPIMDEATLSHCFGLTKPKLIFCDGDDFQKVQLATKNFKPKIITVSEHLEGVSKITDLLEPTKTERFYQPKQYAMADHRTVAILCSSGTTGKPKAVCMNAASLVHDIPYITSETVVYSSSGIDWVTGLFYLVLSCLTGCTRIISRHSFSTEHFLELLKKYKFTNTFLAPRYIAALVKHPLASKDLFSSLQFVNVGRSIISEKLVKDFKALLSENVSLVYGYGFTEFGGISYNINLEHGTSVGKLVPGVSLLILDDNGHNMGPNEVGEICVYHGKQWNGYYDNPIETLRMKDKRDWYHSGDLGYMDDDNYLFVIDRKKETRKFQGLHFWPKEIEEVIAELPDVKDVCVVTIEEETKGDCSAALVVKTDKSTLSENDVIEYVKKRLVVIHKQIHAGVYFVDSIPQNANGKLTRLEAKKILQNLVDRNLVS